jgi:Chromo (CHRromatin Organisation MOdifier) domain
VIGTNSKEAEGQIDEMLKRRAQATAAINKVAHQGGTPKDMFQVRQQVWLEASNLKLPYQTTKLAPKRQGPFKIIKRVSSVAYQLELPSAWNIHNVFHASLLLPYRETPSHRPNFIRPPPELIRGEDEYEVEAIINHRFKGRKWQLEYLLKWKGYPHSDNMWEPKDRIHADQLIKEYHKHTPLFPDKRVARIANIQQQNWTPQLILSTPSPLSSPLKNSLSHRAIHGSNFTSTCSLPTSAASLECPRISDRPPLSQAALMPSRKLSELLSRPAPPPPSWPPSPISLKKLCVRSRPDSSE